MLLGENPPQHLADDMHHTWAEFARTGSLGWQSYNEDERSVQWFDDFGKRAGEQVDDPAPEERELFDGVV
jgi:carboxylesterase type B